MERLRGLRFNFSPPKHQAHYSQPAAQHSSHGPLQTVTPISYQSDVIRSMGPIDKDELWNELSRQRKEIDMKAAATIDMIADVERRKRKRRHEQERKERRRLEQGDLLRDQEQTRKKGRGHGEGRPYGGISIKEATRNDPLGRHLGLPNMTEEHYHWRTHASRSRHRHSTDHYSPSRIEHERSGDDRRSPPSDNGERNIRDHRSPPISRHRSSHSSRLSSDNVSLPQAAIISQTTSVQALFAATPPDQCQNCKVNIAEIERTSSFQFPTMCPICHQPRSLLPLALHQQQPPLLTGQQKITPGPTLSTRKPVASTTSEHPSTSRVSSVDRPITPKQPRAIAHSYPAARGVSSSKSYRPVYTDSERGSSYRPPMDFSRHWVHDKYERIVEEVRTGQR